MAEALSKKARDEYFESGGLIVPPDDGEPDKPEMVGKDGEEEKKEPEKKDASAADKLEIPSFTEKKDEKKEVKGEDKKDEKKADKKEEKKETTDDDPHAENHKKAMQEERSRRKALEKQIKQESEARAALETKFNTFIQAVQQQQAPQPGTQEYEQYRQQNTEAKLQEFEQWKQQQDQARAQQAQMQQFQQAVTQTTAPFIAQTKDYADAYQHVIETKVEEARLAGVPEENVQQQIQAWELQFAALSLKGGLNPAEQLYKYAQRIGYKQKTDEKTAKSDAEKKLESVQKGQEAAKTLNGGGAELSLKTLEQMSDEEINALAKDPKKWSRIAGGMTH